MARRKPDSDAKVEAEEPYRFDCTLLGASKYPDPVEDGMDDIMSYVLHEIVPDQLKETSLAVFLTRDPVSTLWAEVDHAKLDAPGYMCIVQGIEHDALFYISSVLRADAFTYVFARERASEEPVYCVWDRLQGLGAFVARGDEFVRIPPESVRHVLPPTLAEDISEDLMH